MNDLKTKLEKDQTLCTFSSYYIYTFEKATNRANRVIFSLQEYGENLREKKVWEMFRRIVRTVYGA